MSKAFFTSKELEDKGFRFQSDDSEVYFVYLDNPDDVWGSSYIATQSMDAVHWLADYKNEVLFSVIAPPTEDKLETYMTEEEIDTYIANSKNG